MVRDMTLCMASMVGRTSQQREPGSGRKVSTTADSKKHPRTSSKSAADKSSGRRCFGEQTKSKIKQPKAESRKLQTETGSMYQNSGREEPHSTEQKAGDKGRKQKVNKTGSKEQSGNQKEKRTERKQKARSVKEKKKSMKRSGIRKQQQQKKNTGKKEHCKTTSKKHRTEVKSG